MLWLVVAPGATVLAVVALIPSGVSRNSGSRNWFWKAQSFRCLRVSALARPEGNQADLPEIEANK